MVHFRKNRFDSAESANLYIHKHSRESKLLLTSLFSLSHNGDGLKKKIQQIIFHTSYIYLLFIIIIMHT